MHRFTFSLLALTLACSDPVMGDEDGGTSGADAGPGLDAAPVDAGPGDDGGAPTDAGGGDRDAGMIPVYPIPLIATCVMSCPTDSVCDPDEGGCTCRAGYAGTPGACTARSSGVTEPNSETVCELWRQAHLVSMAEGYYSGSGSADECAQGAVDEPAAFDVYRRVDAMRRMVGVGPVSRPGGGNGDLANAMKCARAIALAEQVHRSRSLYSRCQSDFISNVPVSFGGGVPADAIDRILYREASDDVRYLMFDRRGLLDPEIADFAAGYERLALDDTNGGFCVRILIDGTLPTVRAYSWPNAGATPLAAAQSIWSFHLYHNDVSSALVSVRDSGDREVSIERLGDDSVTSWSMVAFRLLEEVRPGESYTVTLTGITGDERVNEIIGTHEYTVTPVDCGF